MSLQLGRQYKHPRRLIQRHLDRMSLFDRLLFREKPVIATSTFWGQFDWMRYKMDVGGAIGIVGVDDFRLGWQTEIDREAQTLVDGVPWGASDEAELLALVNQANDAIATGEALALSTGIAELADVHYVKWSTQAKALFGGMQSVKAANKISKGEANQYLQAIANGSEDLGPIEWIPPPAAARR